MYTIYILRSVSAKKTYVGQTNNLARRLVEHNSGKHAYTKRYVPWQVIYIEEYSGRIESRKRELYFKSAAGRRMMKKIIGEK